MSDQTEAELEKTREAAAAMVADQSAAADAILEPEADADEDVEVVEGEEVDLGWDAYTKEELADHLRDRGLAVSGTKDELVARLNESDTT